MNSDLDFNFYWNKTCFSSKNFFSAHLSHKTPRQWDQPPVTPLWNSMWHGGVAFITTAQLRLTKSDPEVRFCIGSNPNCDVSEIRHREDLWQLEIRLNAFSLSTIPQKVIHHSFIIHHVLRLLKSQCETTKKYF